MNISHPKRDILIYILRVHCTISMCILEDVTNTRTNNVDRVLESFLAFSWQRSVSYRDLLHERSKARTIIAVSGCSSK